MCTEIEFNGVPVDRLSHLRELLGPDRPPVVIKGWLDGNPSDTCLCGVDVEETASKYGLTVTMRSPEFQLYWIEDPAASAAR